MPNLAPFADIEAMLNRDTVGMLANATATWQGGVPFGVLFDRAESEPFGPGAVDTASMSCSFCVVNAPGIAQGAELTIGGVVYVVAGPVQPDAGGWVTLAVYPKD